MLFTLYMEKHFVTFSCFSLHSTCIPYEINATMQVSEETFRFLKPCILLTRTFGLNAVSYRCVNNQIMVSKSSGYLLYSYVLTGLLGMKSLKI